jgi:16S rRNA (guanine527-N7)-methyltransferase
VTSRTGTSSSRRSADWLRAVVETPGLTAIRDLDEARRVLWEDSLRAVPLLEGLGDPIVDIGSGGGAPGIPLALSLPDREVVLLESQRRKCRFLEQWAPSNARVVCGRVEEQGVDWAGAAVAKALAPPPVAVEWCLPLVRPGGAVVLFVGETADVDAVARVSGQVGGGEPEDLGGLLLIPKAASTPPGFPRRPGLARKRPLSGRR